MLFLILINDLDKGIENWILKFADDTKIFYELSQVKDCDKLQKDLELLHKWSVDWQMQFNTEKCKMMHIGRHNPMFTYTIANKHLEAVNSFKSRLDKVQKTQISFFIMDTGSVWRAVWSSEIVSMIEGDRPGK